MHESSPPGPPSPAVGNPEEILCAFDNAWRQGTPRVEDFIAGPAGAPARRVLLQELIKIDLEYRWRRAAVRPAAGAPKAPLLEEYLQRHPELGPPERLALDLIGEEYRVRRRWANRPSHAEYLGRFGRHGQRLLDLLGHIDAELADELDGTAIVSAGKAQDLKAPVPSASSVAGLVDMLGQCGLLSPAQREELFRGSLERFPTAHALGRELLGRDWLTPYQVNQLLQGRGPDLLVGPYQLLERLGAGGAGQVFKARHQKMYRLVALKVLHKDLLTDPESVGRFGREIQILSRLDHPNVVHAYDAGPLGATYFLAMEYVEGTDLARLVKQSGPLPVMQACAYIRQAALGLQHAHERGLVHRDIKPHNLIMSLREGRIKVADLGLARLPRAANEEATAALAAVKTGDSLTPVGAVMMGTLDYLAPEQALDFHKADIRADIYSLGCTLWYLLIGQPPFPVGTLAEKLLSHQSKEPPAIEKLRVDVPAGLARVLQRMLAKQPEDRYRTPAEVAEAVTPYICTPDARELEFDPGGWSVRAQAYTTWAMLCKFARRNKAFTAAVVTAMVLLAWSSVVNYQARQKTEREQAEKDKRTRAAVPALVGSAQMSAVRHNLPEALLQVNLALDYNSDYAPARLLKGQLLIAQLDFEKAQAELRRYLQLQPNDADTNELLRLSQNVHPEDSERLLALAYVLDRQKASGPLVCLEQEILKRKVALEKLVPLWRKQIEAAWPGLGQRLSLEKQISLGLDFSNCQQVRDLSPLKGMPLNSLDLSSCSSVEDLSPLKGMPLNSLSLYGCSLVKDLSPLKGMPLNSLNLYGCSLVKDLSPLKGMPLTSLDLWDCRGVQDLSPLKGTPLTSLNVGLCTKVQDLTPLKGMRLTTLVLHNCYGVQDLTPLKGMPLATLNLWTCSVRDLSPLTGMPLTTLNLRSCSGVRDLSPLTGMPLTTLYLDDCSGVQDLSPLTGTPLSLLTLCGSSGVKDLSPLGSMKQLRDVRLPPEVAKGMNVLRQMKSIVYLSPAQFGGVRAEEFWKKHDNGEFKQYKP